MEHFCFVYFSINNLKSYIFFKRKKTLRTNALLENKSNYFHDVSPSFSYKIHFSSPSSKLLSVLMTPSSTSIRHPQDSLYLLCLLWALHRRGWERKKRRRCKSSFHVMTVTIPSLNFLENSPLHTAPMPPMDNSSNASRINSTYYCHCLFPLL